MILAPGVRGNGCFLDRAGARRGLQIQDDAAGVGGVRFLKSLEGGVAGFRDVGFHFVVVGCNGGFSFPLAVVRSGPYRKPASPGGCRLGGRAVSEGALGCGVSEPRVQRPESSSRDGSSARDLWDNLRDSQVTRQSPKPCTGGASHLEFSGTKEVGQRHRPRIRLSLPTRQPRNYAWSTACHRRRVPVIGRERNDDP
jgi:hypothetical protein